MVVRSLLTAFNGYLKSRTTRNGLNYLAIEEASAHVWKNRVGLLDVDLNFHMNQSSYLYTAELARWNYFAQTGMLGYSLKNRWKFIAATQAIKYKREIPPFGNYQIRTVIEYVDNDKGWVYITHKHTDHTNNIIFGLTSFRLCATDKSGKKLKVEDWLRQSLYSADELEAILAKDYREENTIHALKQWDNAAYAAIQHPAVPNMKRGQK